MCASQQLNLQMEEASSATLDLKASPRMSRASTFLTQILQVQDGGAESPVFRQICLNWTFGASLLSLSAGWTWSTSGWTATTAWGLYTPECPDKVVTLSDYSVCVFDGVHLLSQLHPKLLFLWGWFFFMYFLIFEKNMLMNSDFI